MDANSRLRETKQAVRIVTPLHPNLLSRPKNDLSHSKHDEYRWQMSYGTSPIMVVDGKKKQNREEPARAGWRARAKLSPYV
jgi:hypothetical protein